MRKRALPFDRENPDHSIQLIKIIEQFHTALRQLREGDLDDIEFNEQASSLIRHLQTSIPEWWKKEYKIPANDSRWINLFYEDAYEDYLRHMMTITFDYAKDMYGWKIEQPDREAPIMKKSVEELQDDLADMKEWLLSQSPLYKKALEKAEGDKSKVEELMYGKKLSDEDKRQMIETQVVDKLTIKNIKLEDLAEDG